MNNEYIYLVILGDIDFPDYLYIGKHYLINGQIDPLYHGSCQFIANKTGLCSWDNVDSCSVWWRDTCLYYMSLNKYFFCILKLYNSLEDPSCESRYIKAFSRAFGTVRGGWRCNIGPVLNHSVYTLPHLSGKDHPSYGSKHPEVGRLLSKLFTGRVSTFKGKHHTEESKELNRQKHIGTTHKGNKMIYFLSNDVHGTVDELANYFDVTYQKMYSWCVYGKLPNYIGGFLVVKKERERPLKTK